MSILTRLFFRSRDKPTDSLSGGAFSYSARDDSREKWVDFAAKFYHCERVSKMSAAKFPYIFNNWCRKPVIARMRGKGKKSTH